MLDYPRPLADLEPLTPEELDKLNPVQLLRYAREQGVTLRAPYRGVPALKIEASKPISKALREALRRNTTAIYCLLDEEKDSSPLWKRYKLSAEHRELVRKLARGAGVSCREVLKLLDELAAGIDRG
jgi:hypothetical protein